MKYSLTARSVVACLVAICILASTASAAPTEAASSEPVEESKTAFFRDIMRKPKATIADAIGATARYKGYDKAAGNLDAELAHLVQQGIHFPPTVNKMADKILDKGSATHLLMKALGIKGGVMYRLSPDSQRYALREAVDLKFMPATSVVSEQMSGGDLMGLLVKCVEYREKKGKTKKY